MRAILEESRGIEIECISALFAVLREESTVIAIPTATLRKSLGAAADLAKLWLEDRSDLKARETFEARGRLGDDGSGAVDAYFDSKGRAPYVGHTGRRI